MKANIQRRSSRGFTLIELLIVVIIVAILAAIAIPQFSSSTADAQVAAMDANLAAMRTAIEQYKVQHNGNYPGHVVTAKGAGCTGDGTAGAADSQAAMLAQLQNATDAAGNNCTIASTTFKYGPYLRQGIPTEPINNKTDIAITNTGAAIAPAANAGGGWAYDTISGQFVMNSGADDNGNPVRKWSAH